MVYSHFCLPPVCGQSNTKNALRAQALLDVNRRLEFQLTVPMRSLSQTTAHGPSENWDQVENATHVAAGALHYSRPCRIQKERTSLISIAPLDSGVAVPSSTMSQVNFQISPDHEQW